MAKTKIADVVVPEVYLPYFRQKTTELDALIASGVMGSPENFSFPSTGGDTVNVPYWTPLTGDDEVLDDDGALTPGKRTAGRMAARVHFRGKAWQANELAAALAGSDPHEAIVMEDVKYWQTRRQTALISSLTGFFTTAAAANVHDISGGAAAAAVADGSAFVDAAQKLGDHKGNLAVIVMHSATEALLAKQKLIEYETVDGKSDRIPMYLNKRVIVDDSLPAAGGVYTTYLMGLGSVSYTPGSPVGFTNVETDRDSLAGDDLFIRREAFILHPSGAKWVEDTVAGASPTNAELANADNWGMWENAKNVPIVQFKHRIAAA